MIASASMPGTQRDRLAQVARRPRGTRVRRELRELQRAEDGVLALGVEPPGGDDDAAHRPRAVDPLARLGRERHPAPAEVAVPARLAGGRVAALLVDGAVLGQADHHVAPVELVAVAPLERGDGRGGRPGPRAAGVGEVGHVERTRSLSVQHVVRPGRSRTRRCRGGAWRVQRVLLGQPAVERDVLAARVAHEGQEQQAVGGVVAAPQDRDARRAGRRLADVGAVRQLGQIGAGRSVAACGVERVAGERGRGSRATGRGRASPARRRARP